MLKVDTSIVARYFLYNAVVRLLGSQEISVIRIRVKYTKQRTDKRNKVKIHELTKVYYFLLITKRNKFIKTINN